MANSIHPVQCPAPSEISEVSEAETQVDIRSFIFKLFSPCSPSRSHLNVYCIWLHLTSHNDKTKAQITGSVMH